MNEGNLHFTPDEIATITDGKWENLGDDFVINEIHSIYHYLHQGDMFVVHYPDWNRRNSDNEYKIKGALKKGISALMIKKSSSVQTTIPTLRVEDTYEALKKLALHTTEVSQARRVLITGSFGKTGFKVQLYHAIKDQIKTYTRLNSANTAVSTYCNLASLKQETELLLIEQPVSALKTTYRRATYVRPAITVITSIGHEGIERFQTIETIIKHKLQMANALQEGGKLFLPHDDIYFQQILQEAQTYEHIQILTYGSSSTCQAHPLYKKFSNYGWDVIAKIEDVVVAYRVPFFEEYAVSVSCGVLLCAYHLGLDVHQAADNYYKNKNFKSSGLFCQVNYNNKNFYLYDQSNRGGIEGYESFFRTLSYIQPKNNGRKILVTSEFVDYKDGEIKLLDTQKFQKLIKDSGISALYSVEKFSEHINVLEDKSIWKNHSIDFNNIKDEIINSIEDDDILCVKGIFESDLPEFIKYLKNLKGTTITPFEFINTMKDQNELLKNQKGTAISNLESIKHLVTQKQSKSKHSEVKAPSKEIKLYRFHHHATYQYALVLHPFRFFYSMDGDGKSPQNMECSENKEIPDYVLELLRTFAKAYNIYLGEYGLMNPLRSGIYFEKGAMFIDVMLENIPIQKGLVAAELVDNSTLFTQEESMQGKAIRILLDRNLIKNSATPIHELFHVFQYNYCSFNNMWFMEGLARWAQNITHDRKNIPEKLPSSYTELEALLQRAHDAEYFWRRLIALATVKEEVFLKSFLENCALQASKLEEKYAYTDKYQHNNWDKEEKKSEVNNKYIFSALLNTLGKAVPHKDDELNLFLELLSHYDASNTDKFDTQSIQRFLKVLRQCDKSLVHESDGILHSDYYNVETKTLEIKTLESLNMNEYDLESFNILHHINGDLLISCEHLEALNGFNYLKSVNALYIKDMPNLKEINGFNALVKIDALEISNNPNLTTIDGFNALFSINHEVNKFVKIIKNKKLQSVHFLKGIKSVKSSFYIHQNALTSLEGLEDLENVGASLSFSSNVLTSLMPLQNLKRVNGMLNLAYNKLLSLEGLENLNEISTIKWNGEYKSLALQGNPELSNIKALENMLTSTRYLILQIDQKNKFQNLPNEDSIFFKQDIAIYDGENLVDATILFPNYTKSPKIKVLFSKAWLTVLKEMDWLEAHFVAFEDINKVLEYVKRHNIVYLYGQVYTAQKFLHQHQKQLREAGCKFIVNDYEVMQLLLDKRDFFEFLLQNNLEKFMPKYYPNIENIDYPCVVKKIHGTSGKTVRIVYSQNELGDVLEDEVVNEYIVGDTEYAINLFYKDGKIIEEVTYKKSYSDTFYVLNEDTKYKMVDEVIANPYLNIFTEILNLLFPHGGMLLCCIDYKVKDNMPKIFEINVRLGYTLARNPYDFKKIFDSYILEANSSDKYKILFGKKWKKATSKCHWLDAHHLNFSDIDNVIAYCKQNSIEVLFANNYATHLFVNNNLERFKESGLKFIVNTLQFIRDVGDKQKFYDIMVANNFSAYVPKYYTIEDEIKFPCIVKLKKGSGAGKGISLVYDKKEIDTTDENLLISEYLDSNIEYATSFFCKDGVVLKDITYSKTSQKNIYVLQQESANEIVVKREPSRFLDVFMQIIEAFNTKDGYCACSFNYKIQDGIPKIFEINPRIGYTLAGFCDDFKEMMDVYLKELHDN